MSVASLMDLPDGIFDDVCMTLGQMKGGARALVAVGSTCPAFQKRLFSRQFMAQLCEQLGATREGDNLSDEFQR